MTDLLVKSMYDLEEEYEAFQTLRAERAIDLGDWLPWFRAHLQPIQPGELIVVVADTGHGKSAIAGNIAQSIRPEPALMFHLELPGTLVFERMAARVSDMGTWRIADAYKAGTSVQIRAADHIYVCDKSRLSAARMQEIAQGEAIEKIGGTPSLIVVDYIGLMEPGKGRSRYEQVSRVAEDLKVLAKETSSVVLATTQIHRKDDFGDTEISLHDAKDSGSIEASADLLLGAWRKQADPAKMHIRILKSRRGGAGKQEVFDFDGARMRITQPTPPDMCGAAEWDPGQEAG